MKNKILSYVLILSLIFIGISTSYAGISPTPTDLEILTLTLIKMATAIYASICIKPTQMI